MATVYTQPSQPPPMNTLSSKLRPFLSHSPSLTTPSQRRLCLAFSTRPTKATEAALMKEKWLESLSLPSLENESSRENSESSRFVIGVDPDLSGALALLKFDHLGSSSSAQVFDAPHLPVLVGNKVRKRLDAKSMVQLIQSFHLPSGTRAYIEQSTPFPKDGKQGWYSGGFGYGLWIGTLVASGISVVPVPSSSWKRHFELASGSSTKDDSRRVASELFPAISSQLKRKKDHGRAEALLIAAFGENLRPVTLLDSPEELVSSQVYCLEN